MDKDEKDQSKDNYMPTQTLRIQDPRRCIEKHVTGRHYERNTVLSCSSYHRGEFTRPKGVTHSQLN
jgi:hypothetical protein